MCAFVNVCHMSADTCRGQKRASEPLELELQMVVSFLMWVLGTELKSSGQAGSALNC